MKKYTILLVYFCSCFAFSSQKIAINVYVYHLQPPLVINLEDESGLYFDFVHLLNETSELYQFDVVFVPRKRIDRMLQSQSLDGILLGVNPVWFKDKAETKYLWTTAFLEDRDEVVSLATKPIDYVQPASLKGLVIGGVRGFYYYGINELVSTEKANRVDTVGEADLFDMLLKERVDLAIIGRSAYDYMIKTQQWQGVFHLSKIPHDTFERRILVPQNSSELFQHLSKILSQLPDNQRWQANIASYK